MRYIIKEMSIVPFLTGFCHAVINQDRSNPIIGALELLTHQKEIPIKKDLKLDYSVSIGDEIAFEFADKPRFVSTNLLNTIVFRVEGYDSMNNMLVYLSTTTQGGQNAAPFRTTNNDDEPF